MQSLNVAAILVFALYPLLRVESAREPRLMKNLRLREARRVDLAKVSHLDLLFVGEEPLDGSFCVILALESGHCELERALWSVIHGKIITD